MKDDVNKKVQVLMQKAKESKNQEAKEKNKTQSELPNSLADNIKTEEQAKSFMLLLKSL